MSKFDPAEVVETFGLDALRGLGEGKLREATGLSAWRCRVVAQHLRGLEPASAATGDVVPGEGADSQGSYVYDDAADAYTFRVPGRTHALRLSGEAVRAMVHEYVADGGGQSMHQVAVRHGVSRRDFHKIKALLGVTKLHEPFTPEVIAGTDEDVLLADTLTAKRQRLMKKVESEDLRQTRDWASKWLALQSGTLDPFAEGVKAICDRDLTRIPEASLPSDAVIVHVHPSDLHFGAYSSPQYGGVGYNRAEARRRYLLALDEALEWAARSFDEVAYVLLPAGGDMVHSDNMHGKTSSFRHQMDLDGLPEEILVEAMVLYCEAVATTLAAGFNVRIEAVPGNHDYYTSCAIAQAAALKYRDDPRVFVGNLIAPYAYVVHGHTALVLHHGHGLHKADALADNLQTWARKGGVGYKHGYAVTGNLHHLRFEESPGIVLLQQPAPVEPDRYGMTGGWTTAQPAVISMAFSGRRGLVSTWTTTFD